MSCFNSIILKINNFEYITVIPRLVDVFPNYPSEIPSTTEDYETGRFSILPRNVPTPPKKLQM